MRISIAVAITACLPLFAADALDEKAVLTTVQKLFDAMSAHDSDAARVLLLPEGRVIAIRENGAAQGSTQEQFATRLSVNKEPIRERMWNPTVLIRGRMAEVWADYDFWRDGKFGHCGVDSFSLAKTADGWKIAGIVYTIETTSCSPSPLGHPAEVKP